MRGGNKNILSRYTAPAYSCFLRALCSALFFPCYVFYFDGHWYIRGLLNTGHGIKLVHLAGGTPVFVRDIEKDCTTGRA